MAAPARPSRAWKWLKCAPVRPDSASSRFKPLRVPIHNVPSRVCSIALMASPDNDRESPGTERNVRIDFARASYTLSPASVPIQIRPSRSSSRLSTLSWARLSLVSSWRKYSQCFASDHQRAMPASAVPIHKLPSCAGSSALTCAEGRPCSRAGSIGSAVAWRRSASSRTMPRSLAIQSAPPFAGRSAVIERGAAESEPVARASTSSNESNLPRARSYRRRPSPRVPSHRRPCPSSQIARMSLLADSIGSALRSTT